MEQKQITLYHTITLDTSNRKNKVVIRQNDLEVVTETLPLQIQNITKTKPRLIHMVASKTARATLHEQL